MRISLLTALCVAILFLSFTAMAADVTGKYTGEQPGRQGQTQPVTITLKQDGGSLTGSLSGGRGGDVQISDGKVDGDTVTFTVKREMQGNTMVMKYTGKVSGDTIKFTRTVEGMDRPPQEFSVKKTTT